MEMTSIQEQLPAASPSPSPTHSPSRCWPRLISLLLGQLLSLFICATAVSSEYLHRAGVALPLLQSLLNYFLLAFTFGSLGIFTLTSQRRLWSTLRRRVHLYVLAAVVDVEANFAIVKAYQFTSVTSVQLLDCLSIPTVLVLSLLLLGVRYRWNHFLGVFLCLAGVATMLVADHLSKGSSFAGSQPLLGDLLVILGAVGYGLSNVLQEWLVRRHGQLEYLCLMSLAACPLSVVQCLALEGKAASLLPAQMIAQPLVGVWLTLFAVSMFALYSTMPMAMARSSAVMVNLNLLTADVYALLVGLFLFHYRFHWLYFLAYTGIMFGVTLYVVREPGHGQSGQLRRLLDKICCRGEAEV